MPESKDPIEKPLVATSTTVQASEAAKSEIDMADLKGKSVRGGAVTMVAQAISIAIQLASTVVLARLLSPGDYGVMAMVMAVTGFAGLFRDLGLSSAAIQKKDLTPAQQSNLFWLNVAMGTLLTVLVAAASPLVAWFYGKPELSSVTLALSASFVIGSLGTQHGAMLVREMQFARQAVANIGGPVIGLILSVALALNGCSYWSLVWGNLAGGVVTTSLLFALSPFSPTLFTKGAGVRDMLKFGANVTAFDLVNYFHRNLDNVLIGRFWGSVQLGYYSRAYSLLMLPINAARNPILSVGFPALSSLQGEPDLYRRYFRGMTSAIALTSIPLATYLCVFSTQVIHLTLGLEWAQVIPIFSILAGVCIVQPVLTMWAVVALSFGMARKYLYLGIANTCASATGFIVGMPWGAKGVALGYLVSTGLSAYPLLFWSFHGTPVKIRDFHVSVAKPISASLLSAVVCVLVRPHLEGASTLGQVLVSLPIFSLLAGLSYIFLFGGKAEILFLMNNIRSSATISERPEL